MKVLLVLCLAVASTCALNLRSSKFVDISPVMPFFDPEARITNGRPAAAEQLPYQVGVSLSISVLQSAWCGGSLIARNWVLTAAHCSDGVKSITVYLGSTIRLAGTKISVSEIIVHPKWNSANLENDISLLRIPAVSLSKSINIVPLPAVSNTDYINQAVIASGWGKTKDSGTVTNDLQYAILTIVDNSVCSKVYGSSIVKSSNICLSTPSGTSTCNGDSGGPLVLEKLGLLVGVTSFGAAAGCTLGYPVAFTRVSTYRTWIEENTGV